MERIRSFMTKKDLLVFLSLFLVSFTTTLIGLSIREDNNIEANLSWIMDQLVSAYEEVYGEDDD